MTGALDFFFFFHFRKKKKKKQNEKQKKNLEHLSWSTLISISSGPRARLILSTLPKLNSASVSSYMLVKFFEVKVMGPWLVFLPPLDLNYNYSGAKWDPRVIVARPGIA